MTPPMLPSATPVWADAGTQRRTNNSSLCIFFEATEPSLQRHDGPVKSRLRRGFTFSRTPTQRMPRLPDRRKGQRPQNRVADIVHYVGVRQPRRGAQFLPAGIGGERTPGFIPRSQIVIRQHVSEVGHAAADDGLAEKYRQHAGAAEGLD